MAKHDRARAVSKAPHWWPSDKTLRWIVEQHALLYCQLEPIFGSRLACEMVVACSMRVVGGGHGDR
jgi:hypothetical protein